MVFSYFRRLFLHLCSTWDPFHLASASNSMCFVYFIILQCFSIKAKVSFHLLFVDICFLFSDRYGIRSVSFVLQTSEFNLLDVSISILYQTLHSTFCSIVTSVNDYKEAAVVEQNRNVPIFAIWFLSSTSGNISIWIRVLERQFTGKSCNYIFLYGNFRSDMKLE